MTVVNEQRSDQDAGVAKKKAVAPELAGLRARVRQAVDQRCAERGVSQSGLAAAIGLDPGNLTKILSGESQPSATSLVFLSRGLGVTTDWLLLGIEPSGLGPVRDWLMLSPRPHVVSPDQISETSEGNVAGQVPEQQKIRSERNKRRGP